MERMRNRRWKSEVTVVANVTQSFTRACKSFNTVCREIGGCVLKIRQGEGGRFRGKEKVAIYVRRTRDRWETYRNNVSFRLAPFSVNYNFSFGRGSILLH